MTPLHLFAQYLRSLDFLRLTYISTASVLQTGFSSRLEWQYQCQTPRRDKQRSANIHRYRCFQVRIDSHNRRHDAENPIRRSRQRVPRASIFGGKDFRRVRVEDRIHDIAHEIVRAVPPQQGVGVERGGGTEEEHARESCGGGKGPLSSESWNLDQDASDESARDAEHGDDELVAVCDVSGAVAEVHATRCLDVGQESIVEGESEANESPNEHDDRGGIREFRRGKESADVDEI